MIEELIEVMALAFWTFAWGSAIVVAVAAASLIAAFARGDVQRELERQDRPR